MIFGLLNQRLVHSRYPQMTAPNRVSALNGSLVASSLITNDPTSGNYLLPSNFCGPYPAKRCVVAIKPTFDPYDRFLSSGEYSSYSDRSKAGPHKSTRAENTSSMISCKVTDTRCNSDRLLLYRVLLNRPGDQSGGYGRYVRKRCHDQLNVPHFPDDNMY